jgi:hypothetical protein
VELKYAAQRKKPAKKILVHMGFLNAATILNKKTMLEII